jgi:hypothetical protein
MVKIKIVSERPENSSKQSANPLVMILISVKQHKDTTEKQTTPKTTKLETLLSLIEFQQQLPKKKENGKRAFKLIM